MTDPVADDRGGRADAPPADRANTSEEVAAGRRETSEGDGPPPGPTAGGRRRRGSRGGRNRPRPSADRSEGSPETSGPDAPVARGVAAGEGDDVRTADDARTGGRASLGADRMPEELPDRMIEGRPKSPEAAARALVPKKPRIGDSIPPEALPGAGRTTDDGPTRGAGRTKARSGADDPASSPSGDRTDGNGATKDGASSGGSEGKSGRSRRRRGNRGGGSGGDGARNRDGGSQRERDQSPGGGGAQGRSGQKRSGGSRSGGRRSGGGGGDTKRAAPSPVEALTTGERPDLDDEELESRRGRERKGRPVGRYLMCVSVRDDATHIAVLEGRHLIEHYVSRPSDDVSQIHGNIYLGRVQNVLPGMEAAFVDIATPKNAVLYRGDVQYEAEDIEEKGEPRIEQLLKARQPILCQVTKNPIAHKGARLTTEVSLPGRFVVMIPNSTTVGISKRLADDERKRLRKILDRVRPEGHGLIVRTAAEGVTTEEIEADVARLSQQWQRIEQLARTTQAPALLYREPDMAVRVIREEFNKDYRGVVIDGRELFDEVHEYVSVISPGLAERVQYYDRDDETLPLFERHHVHEQLHKALDRKVWLPSGGSLIIEHTEALTVIDVNTGKNVGSTSLEETVFRNNLEAAEEIARQLRLRDIGGIVVVDFVDMEIKDNREQVIKVFRDALARDKTRTQVFDISELGLVEMTRKRIGEGLIESYSKPCPDCDGRGLVVDEPLIDAT